MKTLIGLLLFCAGLAAQTGVPVQPTNTAPSGSCPNPAMQYVSPAGTVYTCQSGTWAQISNGTTFTPGACLTLSMGTLNVGSPCPTNAQIQAGQLISVTTTSSSTTTYTGVMAANDPLAAYAAGMLLIWNVGATGCGAGAKTLNIDGLGAITLTQGDGSTTLTTAQCPAGAQVLLTYDGTVFRGPLAPGGGGGASITSGAFGSVPSCTSSTFMYQATDSPYYALCNGSSSLQWFFNQSAQTPAQTLTWAWFNQSSSSIATQGGSQVLTGTGGGGNNIQGRTIAVPSTPYSVTACFDVVLPVMDFEGAGIFLTDGTKVITVGPTRNAASGGFILNGANYSNATTFIGQYMFTLAFNGAMPACLTFSDNGTTTKVWATGLAGSNFGANRVLLGSQADSGIYLAATNIGFFVNTGATNLVPKVIVYTFTTVAESI